MMTRKMVSSYIFSLNYDSALNSHRFSTVRLADQIVVIENGRAIEQGNHQELLALNGHYAELFNLQASSYR